MVKSVLSVSHEGLRDWVAQRLSAIVLAVYAVGLVGYILLNPELSFAEWHSLFAMTSIKVATLLFVMALGFHAWIGLWSVITDYIKIFVLRCVLQVGVILLLTACFLWALIILWGV